MSWERAARRRANWGLPRQGHIKVFSINFIIRSIINIPDKLMHSLLYCMAQHPKDVFHALIHLLESCGMQCWLKMFP